MLKMEEKFIKIKKDSLHMKKVMFFLLVLSLLSIDVVFSKELNIPSSLEAIN